MNQYVILVDNQDNPIGISEKLKAHQLGLLHRAFSIVIFNAAGKMLIHQRAFSKYHSPGLWTNACCSHPSPGESLETAIHRRLQEEMGFDCFLEKLFSFEYREVITHNNLIEHEHDHVFYGVSDTLPTIHPDEVHAFAYVDPIWLVGDLKNNPEKYTVWSPMVIPRVVSYHQEQQDSDIFTQQKSL